MKQANNADFLSPSRLLALQHRWLQLVRERKVMQLYPLWLQFPNECTDNLKTSHAGTICPYIPDLPEDTHRYDFTFQGPTWWLTYTLTGDIKDMGVWLPHLPTLLVTLRMNLTKSLSMSFNFPLFIPSHVTTLLS